MPWGDRTGPAGAGPRTGRGAGYCAGFGVPGYMNRPSGMGGGWGGRGGRGGGVYRWRNWFNTTGLPGWARSVGIPGFYSSQAAPGSIPGIPDKGQELEGLKSQASIFETELNRIKERIKNLESE